MPYSMPQVPNSFQYEISALWYQLTDLWLLMNVNILFIIYRSKLVSLRVFKLKLISVAFMLLRIVNKRKYSTFKTEIDEIAVQKYSGGLRSSSPVCTYQCEN